MCGISLLVTRSSTAQSPFQPLYWPSLEEACARRGPHSHKSRQIDCPARETSFTLSASVLSLRGDETVEQPLQTSIDPDLTLAWNGQIYAIESAGSSEEDADASAARQHAAQKIIKEGQNDGQVLLDWLAIRISRKQISDRLNRRDAVEAILDEIFPSLEAEWALVLIDAQEGAVYFGRDELGRRSLLQQSSLQSQHPLLLTSTASGEAIDSEHQWHEVGCGSFWRWEASEPQHLPEMVCDRASRRTVLRELRVTLPYGAAFFELAKPSEDNIATAVDQLHAVLLDSVAARVNLVNGQTAKDLEAQDAPIAILFSGGLDSTILAYYAHLTLEEGRAIDLINVAFENPRVLKAASESRNGTAIPTAVPERKQTAFDTPDRLLSRTTCETLRRLCPLRPWRLVEVNVSYDEYLAQKNDIMATMHPSDSVMDLSLASVLYFAARGAGSVETEGFAKPYFTQARVYVSGLGADELCGGYSRHRKAFESNSSLASPQHEGNWHALAEEMQMDLDRLPTRNLGRDDRILSSHAREARYPFLSSRVISLIASLPLRIKAEMTLPPGEGDKYLLRELARRKCGLSDTAKEKKRAMQWGARSAKMEIGGGKVKGHHALNATQTTVEKKEEASQATAVEAPAEVFTTLCYFPIAPQPGCSFPVDSLLPSHMAAIPASPTAETNEPDDVVHKHRLAQHIPLLRSHLDRLRLANDAMATSFPSAWTEDTKAQRHKVAMPLRLLSALEEEFSKFDSAHSSDLSTLVLRRRVRLAINRTGEIIVTQASMANLPSSSLSTSPPSLPTVRLDTVSSSPTSLRLPETLYRTKTSSRAHYDASRHRVNATLGLPPGSSSQDGEKPCFDVLMWTSVHSCGASQKKRLLSETSIANIILEEVTTSQGRTDDDDAPPVSTFITPTLSPSSSWSRSSNEDATSENTTTTTFLPGLMRQYLLSTGRIIERDVSVEGIQALLDESEDGGEGEGEGEGEDMIKDIQRGTTRRRRRRRKLWLCNALRGVWEVELIH